MALHMGLTAAKPNELPALPQDMETGRKENLVSWTAAVGPVLEDSHCTSQSSNHIIKDSRVLDDQVTIPLKSHQWFPIACCTKSKFSLVSVHGYSTFSLLFVRFLGTYLHRLVGILLATYSHVTLVKSLDPLCLSFLKRKMGNYSVLNAKCPLLTHVLAIKPHTCPPAGEVLLKEVCHWGQALGCYSSAPLAGLSSFFFPADGMPGCLLLPCFWCYEE